VSKRSWSTPLSGDARPGLYHLESKRRRSTKQSSNENTAPNDLIADNTSALTKFLEPSSPRGQQDTSLTLGQIHNGDPAALINQMLEIQKLTTSRDESEEWATNLRFLHVQELGPKAQLIRIPLTRKGEYQNRSDYVAVSYRWQTPADPEPNPGYLIIDADGTQRGNKVPNSVLHRAITYALDNKIPFIWIDQECIPNREDYPEEHGIAIQAMDIVYRRSDHPLGLLQDSLRQKQLILLGELLKRPVNRCKITGAERWAVAPSEEEIPSIHGLLKKVLNDDWWDRAWIFQYVLELSILICSRVFREGFPIYLPHGNTTI
jgi:hypothetical protein